MDKAKKRMGYRWPASALTKNEMAILAGLREETGTPISELLRQTVVEINRQITAFRICQDLSTFKNRRQS